MTNKDLGQIKIGALEITGPVKARISGRFLPDFTVDLTKPPTPGILSVIQPKITFLIGGNAYEIGWGQTSIRAADPKIFEQDTFMDSLQKVGIIPIMAVIGALIYAGYKLIKK